MHNKSIRAQHPLKLVLLASIAALALGSTASFAATSTTASATATVMLPIAISKTADLVFGKFIAGAGDVTVDTAGARTGTGVVLVNSSPGAASFAITGEPSATYAIDFTGSDTTVGDGTDIMALSLFSDLTAGSATSGTAATGTLDGTGNQTLYVGGKLTVVGTEGNGSYTGNIAVAVNYN